MIRPVFTWYVCLGMCLLAPVMYCGAQEESKIVLPQDAANGLFVATPDQAIKAVKSVYQFDDNDSLFVTGCFSSAPFDRLSGKGEPAWELAYTRNGRPVGVFYINGRTGLCWAFFQKGKPPSKTLRTRLKDFMLVFAEPLGLLGLLGQLLFTGRFLLQWLASEKKGKSTVPVAFWYLSISGGLLVLIYAVWRKDPVITLGQLTGIFVYVRNLVLIHRSKREGRFNDMQKVAD